jgi:hypothetical protein
MPEGDETGLMLMDDNQPAIYMFRGHASAIIDKIKEVLDFLKAGESPDKIGVLVVPDYVPATVTKIKGDSVEEIALADFVREIYYATKG